MTRKERLEHYYGDMYDEEKLSVILYGRRIPEEELDEVLNELIKDYEYEDDDNFLMEDINGTN